MNMEHIVSAVFVIATWFLIGFCVWMCQSWRDLGVSGFFLIPCATAMAVISMAMCYMHFSGLLA